MTLQRAIVPVFRLPKQNTEVSYRTISINENRPIFHYLRHDKSNINVKVNGENEKTVLQNK